jgi:hypothetical protein
MKAINQTESRAIAALLTETINCFSRKPELTGAALVKSLGKRQRWFDPALLRAYVKLTA